MKFNTDSDSNGKLHPEGTWDAVITSVDLKESKTGRPMIVADYKTSQGKVRYWHTWVEQYPFIFLNPMKELGLGKEYFDSEPELEDVALELLRRRVLIDVAHEDYQGNPTAKIVAFKPIPDSGIKPSAKPEPKPVEEDLGDEPF